MLAFTMSAKWLPGHPEFVQAAQKACDWWAGNIPVDLVAFWDFDDPAAPHTFRDTSATAIATAELLKLAALIPNGDSYKALAERTAHALIEGYLKPVAGLADNIGILGSGCYNKLAALATNNELVWGDYYFTEALAVLDGEIDPLAV